MFNFINFCSSFINISTNFRKFLLIDICFILSYYIFTTASTTTKHQHLYFIFRPEQKNFTAEIEPETVGIVVECSTYTYAKICGAMFTQALFKIQNLALTFKH